MSEKRNRRDLINEIIEKLQFELDPRARHYIKNFSVTMRLRPPEAVLAPTGDAGDVCSEVCSKVQCMKLPECQEKKVKCVHKCDHQCSQECDRNCNAFQCPSLSRSEECKNFAHQLSHHSSLGNPDVQKSLKSKMKE